MTAQQTGGTRTSYAVNRIVCFEGEGALKAYCDLAINDEVVIKGLRVVEGKHKLFVSFPRQMGKDSKWYDNVVLLTKHAEQAIGETVLAAYHAEQAAYARETR